MGMNWIWTLFCTLFFIQSCIAKCPNMCNQQGSCGENNACTCYDGYTGLDCSSRICATGVAWADKAKSTDLAHQTVECSNAGICDTQTGNCKCFAGYTGTSCQRLSCPNDCSNRGQCMSMRDASVYFGRDYDATVDSSGDGVGFEYDNWDSRSIQICKCDYGFMGADCSLVMCPKGDDPLTTGQGYRTVKLEVSTLHYKSLTGDIGITFHGETTFISLTSPSSSLCQAQLKESPHFQDLTCEYTQNAGVMSFKLTFLQWPRAPKENNFYSHTGNPPVTDFFCDVSRIDASTKCSFTDIVSTNVIEHEFCSNRGMCDFKTGHCTCVDGFGGMACENITNRYSDDTNALIGREVVLANPTDFESTVFRIHVEKEGYVDFQHIMASSNNIKHFEVRGDGELGATKLNILNSGMTIARGGMNVESGGFTVSTDGAYVYSFSDTFSVLNATSSSSAFIDDALEIKGVSSTASNMYLLRTYNREAPMFSVRGDGLVNADGGGVAVTGGTSVATGGILSTGGISVADSGVKATGGLTVQVGGLYITGGATISQTGLKVTGGGTLYGGMTVTAGGITVTAGGSDISAGGLLISANGATVSSGGMRATDGITVNSDGMTVTGGLSILTGGLKVTGGITVHDNGFDGTHGLTVVAGGLKATGGLTVDGGATVTGGLTVVTDGMKVTSGASIRTTGMTVVDGVTIETSGIGVSAGGMQITGGLTVHSSGARITGGISIIDTGFYVENSGASIFNGVKITGGLTVLNSGVAVTGGVKVTGGITVFDSGMKVTGGVTTASTLEVLADGASISSGGLKVNGGVTVHDDGFRNTGMQVTGGLTLRNVGMHVTGGMTLANTGIFVTGDGGTIASEGVSVSGGFETNKFNVLAGGITVTGGLTVTTGGMKVTGGVTYSNSGMIVPSGLSVLADGLKITGGLTVSSTGLHVDGGGIRVTGGLTLDTGIKVTGGLTTTGLEVTANGVSITGGIKVTGGVTVTSSGLNADNNGFKITGGLSIYDSSLRITGGLTVSDTGLGVDATGATLSGGLKVASGVTITSNALIAPDLIITGGISALSGGVITGGLTVHTSGFKSESTNANYIVGDSHSTGTLCIQNNLNGNFLVNPSDRRLKTNITPVKNSLDSITKLRGVYFKWSSDSPQSKFHQKRNIGLIAQDVQKLFPDLVTKIMDGDFLGVNYIQLIPVLIDAVRELDESYSQLETDYKELGIRSEQCSCRRKYNF